MFRKKQYSLNTSNNNNNTNNKKFKCSRRLLLLCVILLCIFTACVALQVATLPATAYQDNTASAPTVKKEEGVTRRTQAPTSIPSSSNHNNNNNIHNKDEQDREEEEEEEDASENNAHNTLQASISISDDESEEAILDDVSAESPREQTLLSDADADEEDVDVDEDHDVYFDRPQIDGMRNSTQLSYNAPYESEWRQHPHLVIFSVLTTDDVSKRGAMRDYQRSTWLKYPDVATLSNSFQGLMLVLYSVALRNSTGPLTERLSSPFLDEMERHHDLLVLRMKEEVPTIKKVIGATGGYGLPLQVSNARKRFMFMLYAYHAFPEAPFIAKGDDDTYVYVPEYLRMLKQMPRVNVIYGLVRRNRRDYPDFPKRTATGPGYAVTRDILRDVMEEPLVNALLITPFDESLESKYRYAYFHHEDCTFARTLERMYRPPNGTRVRALPPLSGGADDDDDTRLPAVEGWGKAYTAYLRNPQKAPRTGQAVSRDGRYDVTFEFPALNELVPGNVLWVNDEERMKHEKRPGVLRLIIAHRPVTQWDYQAYLEHHVVMGEDKQMMRPHHINVVHHGYFNDVLLGDMMREESN